jgi:RecA-family ATPase
MGPANENPGARDTGVQQEQSKENVPANTPIAETSQAQINISKVRVRRDRVERLLAVLDYAATSFTFQTFDDNEQRREQRKAAGAPDLFAKVRHGTLDQYFHELCRLNESGAGIFITINETDGKGRKGENITRVRALFADLDGAPLEPVMAHQPPPHLVVQTSPNRFHAYWFVEGLPFEQFKASQQALARKFGGDAVHDLPRVMRLPGFLHRKGEPFLVQIIHDNSGFPYAAAVVTSSLNDEEQTRREFEEQINHDAERATAEAANFTSDDRYRNLNTYALTHLDMWVPMLFPHAKRSGSGWRVSSKHLGRNLQEDISFTPQGVKDFGVHDMGDERTGKRSPIDVAMEWMQLDFWGAVDLLEQKLGLAAAPAKKTDNKAPIVIRRIDFSDWDNKPVPEQPWAVIDRIPAEHVTLFTGQGGAGKSLLQLLLSCAAPFGKEWLGVTPRQGPSLFIDCEDPEAVLHIRLKNALDHYHLTFAETYTKLHLVSWNGEDSVLGFFNRQTNRIEPTALYKALFEMVGDLKPTIVGLASVTNVFAGNEIDRTQVQHFVDLLTRIARVGKCGFSLIAHPSVAGITTDTGLSGSTQWHNAVRARMYLKGVKEKADELNSKDNLRVLEFRKNNYGPISDQVHLRWENGLFLPIKGASFDAAARSTIVKDVFVAILGRFHKMNRKARPNTGRGFAPDEFFDQKEAKDAGCTKKELKQAMDDLRFEGRIKIINVGPPSKSAQELKLAWTSEEIPF